MTQDEIQAALDDITDAVQAVWNKYGWVKGQLGIENSGFCMMGAWYKATGQQCSTLGTVTPSPENSALNQAFRQSFLQSARELFPLETHASVEGFNDADRHSEEDVRLVAKHAIPSMGDLLE